MGPGRIAEGVRDFQQAVAAADSTGGLGGLINPMFHPNWLRSRIWVTAVTSQNGEAEKGKASRLLEYYSNNRKARGILVVFYAKFYTRQGVSDARTGFCVDSRRAWHGRNKL